MIFLRVCVLTLMVALTVGYAVPVRAETAATAVAATGAIAVVKNFYAQLVEAMKLGDTIGYAGRYKLLDPAVRKAFDMEVMTRLAVGPVWASTTPEEREQLVEAFSAFSTANYASQFKAYDGETFTVGAVKPTPGGVIVETQLQPKDGDAVALNYLMRKDGKGKWRIVDVFLNGAISQLAARRSEFDSIVKRDGLAALVNTLDEKTKQMGPS